MAFGLGTSDLVLGARIFLFTSHALPYLYHKALPCSSLHHMVRIVLTQNPIEGRLAMIEYSIFVLV